MENRSTIVLADANEEFRSSLQQAIEETGEFTVVGSTGDGMAALQLVAELRPQLLVADLLLPSLDGFGLLGENAHTTKECSSLASFERNVKLSAAVMRALFANPELVR